MVMYKTWRPTGGRDAFWSNLLENMELHYGLHNDHNDKNIRGMQNSEWTYNWYDFSQWITHKVYQKNTS